MVWLLNAAKVTKTCLQAIVSKPDSEKQNCRRMLTFAAVFEQTSMSRILTFLKNWALPVSIVTGIVAYFVFTALPLSAAVHLAANRAVGLLQPALIFCMLFLSFCKVDPRNIRLRWWHLWLTLIQSGSFIAMALIIRYLPIGQNTSVLLQSAMVCLLCPTATAAAVVTDKLGGDIASTVTYTIIANLMCAVVASLFIPVINPAADVSFAQAFARIISKVFSILVVPMILAILVRYCLPRVHRWILRPKDLAFYLWTVALAMALTVTTRSIVHTDVPAVYVVLIGIISLACCLLQFFLGRRIGSRYGDTVTAGQALGQKNTVFIIWMANTFMNPVTAVGGGLYSIWHNLVNSWQLYRRRVAESQ